MSTPKRILVTITAFATLITGVSAFFGCAGAGGASKPAVGSTRIFDASAAEVNSAVVNAFTNGHYCDMLLSQAVGSGELIRGWHPTNGFVLEPGTGSLYRGCFHVVVTPAATNETQVVVRTLWAEAVDGREPGVHGGWAFHFRKIPPDPQQERNVLWAVAEQLDKRK